MEAQASAQAYQPQPQMGDERTEPGQVLATESLKKSAGARTSDYYHTEGLPHRLEYPDTLEGYGSKPQNPLYTTSSMSHGKISPSVHTMPSCFKGRTNKFSDHLGKCGMYRNEGLNTSKDTSRV